MTEKKKVVRKRARTAKGRFKADDPSTPFINEAYEKIYTFKDYFIAAVILAGLITVFILNKL
jgi:hypothetical protein